ncbi:RDD family protein [Thermodesulfobacteriota bacterium]
MKKGEVMGKGKNVIIVGLFLMVAVALCPPWRGIQHSVSYKPEIKSAGYAFVFSPPRGKGPYSVEIDWSRLVVQMIAICAGTGALLIFFSKKKSSCPPLNSNTEIPPVENKNTDSSHQAPKVYDENKPRPWVRFWARGIDMGVFGILVAIMCTFLWSIDVFNSNPNMAIWLFLLMSVGLFPFWQALCLNEFNTPGKALLKVTVRKQDGGRLTLEEAIRREFSVLFFGQFLQLPILCLFPMGYWHKVLKNGGQARWDKSGNISVSHGEIVFARWATVFVALFFIQFSIGLYGAAARDVLTRSNFTLQVKKICLERGFDYQAANNGGYSDKDIFDYINNAQGDTTVYEIPEGAVFDYAEPDNEPHLTKGEKDE